MKENGPLKQQFQINAEIFRIPKRRKGGVAGRQKPPVRDEVLAYLPLPSTGENWKVQSNQLREGFKNPLGTEQEGWEDVDTHSPFPCRLVSGESSYYPESPFIKIRNSSCKE